MANKRILKKQIQRVCGDIAAECIFAIEYIPGIDDKKMSNVICRVAVAQQKALEKSNFTFDKVPADFENQAEYNKAHANYSKLAYNSLKDSFNNEINEIVKEMNSLLPAAAREANKEAASSL